MFVARSRKINNPEILPLEVVERKCSGHPDSLADELAMQASNSYSDYCRRNFGHVLHHNFDKLYIGAGFFKSDFGRCQRIKPVTIRTNGRVSGSFGPNIIEPFDVMVPSLKQLLSSYVPDFADDDFDFDINASQHSRLKNWFRPQSIADLPEVHDLRANDTCASVSWWPLSSTEKLVHAVDRYFFSYSADGPKPKHREFGQDIKIFAERQAKTVFITVAAPALARTVASESNYKELIQFHNRQLFDWLEARCFDKTVHLRVFLNPYRIYLLGRGSCIECGEEGLVGRGNRNWGLISAMRPSTQEARSGKNPVYHSGRVFGAIAPVLAKELAETLNSSCTVILKSECGGELITPDNVRVFLSDRRSPRDVKTIVENVLEAADWSIATVGPSTELLLLDV